MTPEQIRAAITANAELQVLAAQRQYDAIAQRLSALPESKKHVSKIVQADELADYMDEIAAEKIIRKLETARTEYLAAAADDDQLFGKALQRKLRRFEESGIDFGSAQNLRVFQRLRRDSKITVGVLSALRGIAQVDDPVTHNEVVFAV